MQPAGPSASVLRRLQEILYEHQVGPSVAEALLQRAVQEVAWRRHATAAARDARLIRAVERRARAYRDRRMRCWLSRPEELGPEEHPS